MNSRSFNQEIESIRNTALDGRNFLVSPITLMKAMELDKRYVPKKHVAEAASRWEGTPITFGHPRDPRGNLVSANAPCVGDKVGLGFIANNKSVNGGGKTKGEAWFDVERVKLVGGQAKDALNNVADGKPLSVSSAYFFDRLPPGVYDGEHREEVVGNLQPDHVAVLLNKDDIYSIADGCMVGEPAANSIMFAINAEECGRDAWAKNDSLKQPISITDEQPETLYKNLLTEYRNGGRSAVENADIQDDVEVVRVAFIKLMKEHELERMANRIVEEGGSDFDDPDKIAKAPYDIVHKLAESVGVVYGGGTTATNVDASSYPSLSARAFMREKKEQAENVSQNGDGSSFPSLSASEWAEEIGGDD